MLLLDTVDGPELIRGDVVSTVRLVPQLERHDFHHPLWDSNPVLLPAWDAPTVAEG